MTRNHFFLAGRLAAVAGLAGLFLLAGAGCRSGKKQAAAGQDPGTSTGLPYRPPGMPEYVDRPATFPVYPTPTPAAGIR